MDYKEEYQNALERAKKGMPIDEVFPELKESEDDRIRKEMMIALKEAEDSIVLTPFKKKSWIAYLEKHKEQQPAEWSAEDEEMIDAMIDIVSHSLYEPLCPREGMLAWLVSLRPYPHWKPSKEQMEALLWCAAHLGGADHRVLAELYEYLNMHCL